MKLKNLYQFEMHIKGKIMSGICFKILKHRVGGGMKLDCQNVKR